MIVKGSARGQSAADTLRLARHLVAANNETVTVLELRGTVAGALPEALEECGWSRWRRGRGGRCTTPRSISPVPRPRR